MIISAIDRNDRENEKTAIYIPFSKIQDGILSEKAKAVIKYFDDTAWLFIYKGRLVLTDESMALTEAGDGSRENPICFPRWTGDTTKELNAWLEAVYEDLEDDEVFQEIING